MPRLGLMKGISRKRNRNLSLSSIRVRQYGEQCQWMKSEKFLRDIDEDSVDTEILDVELQLQCLQQQQDTSSTWRGRMVKFVESNPWQIFMCILIIVDVFVVVAEILLDVNAMKSQFQEATHDLKSAMEFLKDLFPDQLSDYEGDNIHYMIGKLLSEEHLKDNGSIMDDHVKNRTRRSGGSATAVARLLSLFSTPQLERVRSANGQRRLVKRDASSAMALNETGQHAATAAAAAAASVTSSLVADVAGMSTVAPSFDGETTTAAELLLGRIFRSSDPAVAVRYAAAAGSSAAADAYFKQNTYAEKLMSIVHVFHYCSIAILGIFVAQVVIKIVGMGPRIFQKKIEVFDAGIILASFTLDLIFSEGSTGVLGEEAVVLMIVFLLWRILRIINGVLITAEKRQEFRIKLQKCARKKATKKIEILEDQNYSKELELANLKALCCEMGATEENIATCKPRTNFVATRNNITSVGLSSIASLSFGMAMSVQRCASPFPAIILNHPIKRRYPAIPQSRIRPKNHEHSTQAATTSTTTASMTPTTPATPTTPLTPTTTTKSLVNDTMTLVPRDCLDISNCLESSTEIACVSV